jgi:small multidrug resistance pump
MRSWFILMCAILVETVATSALKYSDGFTRLAPTLVVILGYLLSFYLMTLTLRTIPIGVAYAVWGGIGISLITLVGWLFLGQTLAPGELVGIALIATGVVVIRVFSPATIK